MFHLEGEVQEAVVDQLNDKQTWSIPDNYNLIYEAVLSSNHEELIELLSNVNLMSNKYLAQLVLDVAVIQGDEITVELLLIHGVHPNADRGRECWPESPLAQAIKNEDHEIIRSLVNHGCDPDAKLDSSDDRGVTIVLGSITLNYWCKVIEKNDPSTFQCLLECTGRKLGNDEWSQTMLLIACRLGKIQIIEYFLDQGVSINSTDENGWTCIFYAVHNSHRPVIQLLIERGANLQLKDSSGCSILHYLALNDKVTFSVLRSLEEILRLLINHGAKIDAIDINNKKSQNMLITASSLGSHFIVEYLLNQGVSIESVDENQGWTSIFHAVNNMDLPVIQQLIDRGANLKHKDSTGRTVLHIAALSKNNSGRSMEAVRILIQNGAEINTTDNDGFTPINAALNVSYRKCSVILGLLSHPETDFTKPDVHGVTALHRAVKLNSETCFRFNLLVRVLSKPNVDINVRDENNKTPLDYVEIGKLDALGLLLEFGASTERLYHLSEGTLKDQRFLRALEQYRLKRSLVGLSDDLNINNIINQFGVCTIGENNFKSRLLKEIKFMKKIRVYDKLTLYDFLHAKRLTCIKVAKIPKMRKIFNDRRHGLYYYANLLAKNYLNGLRPLTPIESKAIHSAEENLDMICNNNLPSLVLYEIKKYLDLEDMVNIDNMKLFE